jgi:hypothetical protein
MILLFTLCFLTIDIESLYVHGEYDKVIEQAPLVLSDTTLYQTDRIRVNKFYAFSLAIMGRKEEAIEVFDRILNLQPDFVLDPVKISPKIINIFNEAKTKRRLSAPITIFVRDTIYIERKRPLTTLIPGIYQIQRDKRVKGYAILAAELFSLAALGVSQYHYNRSHDEYLAAENPSTIDEKYKIYNGWHKRRLLFISTSIIIWLYNIIDALNTEVTQDLNSAASAVHGPHR